jgi:hypothetical protein
MCKSSGLHSPILFVQEFKEGPHRVEELAVQAPFVYFVLAGHAPLDQAALVLQRVVEHGPDALPGVHVNQVLADGAAQFLENPQPQFRREFLQVLFDKLE